MPKYLSLMSAATEIRMKYNSVILTGDDWFDMAKYSLDVAYRYWHFVKTATGIELPWEN